MTAKWLENVNNLIKEKDIKIGEFEKSIKVSTGYLSRLKVKIDNGEDVMPTVSVLNRISKTLGVSMDMLVNFEIPVNQENLATLGRLIDKFIIDTNERKIVWDAYSLEELTRNGEQFTRELFKREFIADHTPPTYSDEFDPDVDYTEWSDECFYKSQFDEKAQVYGECYKGTISEYEYVFIVPVIVEEKKGWEMYMQGHYNEFCGSDFEKLLSTLEKPTNILVSKVLDLIDCLKRNRKDAYIGLGLRTMIDEYMGK